MRWLMRMVVGMRIGLNQRGARLFRPVCMCGVFFHISKNRAKKTCVAKLFWVKVPCSRCSVDPSSRKVTLNRMIGLTRLLCSRPFHWGRRRVACIPLHVPTIVVRSVCTSYRRQAFHLVTPVLKACLNKLLKPLCIDYVGGKHCGGQYCHRSPC